MMIGNVSLTNMVVFLTADNTVFPDLEIILSHLGKVSTDKLAVAHLKWQSYLRACKKLKHPLKKIQYI